MARGLGAMLAEMRMAEEKQRIEEGNAIPCPLCGIALEFSGCVWQCMTPHAFTETQKDAAFAASQSGEVIFEGQRAAYWDPSMQGVLVAGVLSPTGDLLGTFGTVRGRNGRTAWVAVAEDTANKAHFPAMVRRYGWILQDFMKEE